MKRHTKLLLIYLGTLVAGLLFGAAVLLVMADHRQASRETPTQEEQ